MNESADFEGTLRNSFCCSSLRASSESSRMFYSFFKFYLFILYIDFSNIINTTSSFNQSLSVTSLSQTLSKKTNLPFLSLLSFPQQNQYQLPPIQQMFLHKSAFHRNYKYSHPLAGTVYNNQNYTMTCRSYLQSQIKLSTTASEDVSAVDFGSKDRKQKEREKKKNHQIRHVQSVSMRLEDKQGKNNHKGHMDINRMHKTGTMSDFYVSRPQKKNQPQTSNIFRKRERKSLKRKLAINPYTDRYLFPNIELRIINKITSVPQIQKQSIHFNFEPYFKKLINSQLLGQFTTDFLFRIQKYIKQIMQNEEMLEYDEQEDKEPNVLTTLSRKEDLIDLINEMQSFGQNEKVLELVKYYCIPARNSSQTLLQQLIQDIVIELYQKKNCSKDQNYALLTQQGNIITNISQIYFSTRRLLISTEHNASSTYSKYKKMLQDHDKQQRMTFKQSIKHNFVNSIVKNKIDYQVINYDLQPEQQELYRKSVIEQAQEMIRNRSKNRLSRNTGSSNQKRHQLTADDLRFVVTAPATRQSFFRATQTHRKVQQRLQYKQIIAHLHKILDPSNSYSIQSKIQQKMQKQFNHLHRLNDQYDLTFAHQPENQNKILLKCLIQRWDILQGKNQRQLNKIIQMIAKVQGITKEQLKYIEYGQFKELLQIAHGVADPEIIIRYVLAYLSFDQWGQLTKKDLFQHLKAAVPLQGRPLTLVQEIIWNWLQRSQLVENDVLRKRNIEIWYQPVRVVYLLLLSVIFGKEYNSFEQMFMELVKYQFY